ncbi:MAG TPA: efflux RND transporter permease subunit [Burkholderiaceae bacterium]|nr:efflux RND transporter permease subunit [Burkholderiaceae bacterium]
MKRVLDHRNAVGLVRGLQAAGRLWRAPAGLVAGIGLLLAALASIGGPSAVSWTSPPASFASTATAADGQPCELLLIVHLLASGVPPTDMALARVEAMRGQVEAAIAQVPGVAQVRVFGDSEDVGESGYAASTRSLLNQEPTLAIAVFRARDAEARAVAADVRGVLTRLGAGFGQDSEGLELDLGRGASAQLRWAIAFDTTRFVERSIAAGIAARLEALWSGTGRTPEPRYLVTFVQLPDGATLERTDALLRRVSAIAFTHPAIESAMAFAGLSIDGSRGGANAGLVFLTLRPHAGQHNLEWSASAIAAALNDRFARVDKAVVTAFAPDSAQARARGQADGHRSDTGRAGDVAPSLVAVFSHAGGDEPSLLATVGPHEPEPNEETPR